jgi:hypothetical protein
MWKWIVLGLVVVTVGATVIATRSRQPYPNVPSPRPADPPTPHFAASVERLTPDTFKVVVKPTTVESEVWLVTDLTYVMLLVLDKNGREVASYYEKEGVPKAITKLSSTDGSPDRYGHIRSVTAIFRVDTSKLSHGTYIVSVKVIAAEEGKKSIQGNAELGGIPVRVTNTITLTRL